MKFGRSVIALVIFSVISSPAYAQLVTPDASKVSDFQALSKLSLYYAECAGFFALMNDTAKRNSTISPTVRNNIRESYDSALAFAYYFGKDVGIDINSADEYVVNSIRKMNTRIENNMENFDILLSTYAEICVDMNNRPDHYLFKAYGHFD